MKKGVVAALACAVAIAGACGRAASPAGADTPFLTELSPIQYGVSDDAAKYATDGGAWFDSELRAAHFTEERWSPLWDPANPAAIEDLPFLQRAAPQAQADGVHVVLALYSAKASVHDPQQFCAWAGQVAAAVGRWGITDFIVGNEPNIRTFWVPQFDAAGNDVAAPAFEALLARCYDAIHAANPDARVIGMGLSPHATNRKSNHPLTFLRDVGKAYRDSGRAMPIMDQLAIHPYPNPSSAADSPEVGYTNPEDFGIPNLDRVKQAVYDAFAGTGQPTTLNGLTFRIDEVGWQVKTAKLPQYIGNETAKTVTPEQQVMFLDEMVQWYLACDPTVTDVLLFHLEDERYRGSTDAGGKVIGGGWQSGLLTYGGPGVSKPRPAYGVMATLAAVGRLACTSSIVTWTPGQSLAVKEKNHAKSNVGKKATKRTGKGAKKTARP